MIDNLCYLLLQIYLCGCIVTGMLCLLFLLEHSPPLYHAYMIMTSFLWVQIISQYQFIKALWKHLFQRRMNHIIKLLATTAVSVFIAEFLVCIFSIILSNLGIELFRIVITVLHSQWRCKNIYTRENISKYGKIVN